MTDDTTREAEPEGETPPPLLGTWNRIYAVVLFELFVCVALLYALARWAA
jgi:hypothetical protein